MVLKLTRKARGERQQLRGADSKGFGVCLVETSVCANQTCRGDVRMDLGLEGHLCWVSVGGVRAVSYVWPGVACKADSANNRAPA